MKFPHLFYFQYRDDYSLASVPRLHSLRHNLLPAPRLPWPRLQQQELQGACSLLWSVWVSPGSTDWAGKMYKNISEYRCWPPWESGCLSQTSSAEMVDRGWGRGRQVWYLPVTVQTRGRTPPATISYNRFVHPVTTINIAKWSSH